MDDLSACLVQYADNGKLLPRGGMFGWIFIYYERLSGYQLAGSTYERNYEKKPDPLHTFDVIKRNHMPGGMMSYESADDLKFYISHGYCPDNASKTLEWAFQDWGQAGWLQGWENTRMHVCLKKRSRAWTPLFNAELGLVFRKEKW